jgi:hypothetical protein
VKEYLIGNKLYLSGIFISVGDKEKDTSVIYVGRL